MRTVCSLALLHFLLAVQAAGQETAQPAPKLKVAVIRLDRLRNYEAGGYEKLRLLQADKETREALKKLNSEIKSLQKELIGIEDEVQLAEMGKRIEFLNRKANMLKQRTYNDPFGDQGRQIEQYLRDFVIQNYGKQYPLIAMDPGVFDRFLYKGDVEILDISDEAAANFSKHLNETFGD